MFHQKSFETVWIECNTLSEATKGFAANRSGRRENRVQKAQSFKCSLEAQRAAETWFNNLTLTFCFRDSLGWLQAHIWFSYENIRWEEKRGKKEATQHNLIWTFCGLISLFLSFLFFLALLFSRMLHIHQGSTGNWKKRGPPKCTRLHICKTSHQGLKYVWKWEKTSFPRAGIGKKQRRAIIWVFSPSQGHNLNCIRPKQTLPQIKAFFSGVTSSDAHTKLTCQQQNQTSEYQTWLGDTLTCEVARKKHQDKTCIRLFWS